MKKLLFIAVVIGFVACNSEKDPPDDDGLRAILLERQLKENVVKGDTVIITYTVDPSTNKMVYNTEIKKYNK